MSETMNIRPRRAAFVTALLLIVPSAVFAQMAGPVNADEAGAAHRKAEEILATSQTGKWSQAAKLLEQAAEARAADDAAAVGERVAAAELFHFTGSLARAQTNLAAAAQQAVAEGRVFEAAQILLKAAKVAQERGQVNDAITYARSAERLGRSPHLTPVESAEIRDGIVWLPMQVKAVS